MNRDPSSQWFKIISTSDQEKGKRPMMTVTWFDISTEYSQNLKQVIVKLKEEVSVKCTAWF